MSKTLEEMKKGGVTQMGFAVSGAPIWLFEELKRESSQYYNNIYWPVLVEWYRKAKEFDNIVRGGIPAPDSQIQPEEIVVEEKESPGVKLFGGNVGK